jgi:hypothetical protein
VTIGCLFLPGGEDNQDCRAPVFIRGVLDERQKKLLGEDVAMLLDQVGMKAGEYCEEGIYGIRAFGDPLADSVDGCGEAVGSHPWLGDEPP